MRADGLLFDKDGTLFDFQASWGGWMHALLTDLAGGDAAPLAAMAAGLDFDLATRRFHPESVAIAGTVLDIRDRLLPHLPGRGADELAAALNLAAENVRPVPVVPLAPYLQELAEFGLALGLATNDAEAAARVQLRGLGIEDAFDFIAGFDSGHGAKPAPGMCLAFARSMRLDPGRLVMVGDSLHDLHAGRAAGMQTVAVLTGVARAADLAEHADVVLPDIAALTRWIRG